MNWDMFARWDYGWLRNKNRLQQKSSDLCHLANIKNRTPYLHNKSHKNAVSSKIINAVKMIPFNNNILILLEPKIGQVFDQNATHVG